MAAYRIGVQDVGQVNVSDELSGSASVTLSLDWEAGESGGRDQSFDAGRGHVGWHGDQGVERQSDRVRVHLLERQCTGEQIMLIRLEQSFFARLADQGRYRVAIRWVANLTDGFYMYQPEQSGGYGGKGDDHRPED